MVKANMGRTAGMPTLQELLADVDDARDELVALAQSLVRIPTVNTGIMPTGHETEAAEVVRAALEAAGIPAEVIESAPGRGNLIARWRGGGARDQASCFWVISMSCQSRMSRFGRTRLSRRRWLRAEFGGGAPRI